MIQAFEWYTIPEDSARAWFFHRDRNGGGVMMDFGCHRIEVLLNLLGPVDEVRGLVGNTLFPREVEDTAAACFRFRDGPIGMLAVSVSVKEPHDSLDLYGSEGSLHVPVLNQGTLRVLHRGEEHRESHPPHANLHQPLIEDFAAAVLQGGSRKSEDDGPGGAAADRDRVRGTGRCRACR